MVLLCFFSSSSSFSSLCLFVSSLYSCFSVLLYNLLFVRCQTCKMVTMSSERTNQIRGRIKDKMCVSKVQHDCFLVLGNAVQLFQHKSMGHGSIHGWGLGSLRRGSNPNKGQGLYIGIIFPWHLWAFLMFSRCLPCDYQGQEKVSWMPFLLLLPQLTHRPHWLLELNGLTENGSQPPKKKKKEAWHDPAKAYCSDWSPWYPSY